MSHDSCAHEETTLLMLIQNDSMDHEIKFSKETNMGENKETKLALREPTAPKYFKSRKLNITPSTAPCE